MYALVALEYRNENGETFKMVGGFGIDHKVVSILSLLTRMFF